MVFEVRGGVVLVVGLLGLLLAACSGAETMGDQEETVPSESSATVGPGVGTEAGALDGIWWKPRDPSVSRDIPVTVQIGPGELFVLDGRAQLTSPIFRGRYTFVDDVVSYDGNEIAEGPCSPGDGPTRWSVVIVADGEIGTEVLEDGVCSAEIGTRASMIRLSPASAAGAAISPPEGEFDSTLTLPSQLKGLWLRQGTGEVLYFDVDGTFARSDGGDVVAAPDDRGAFALERDDAAATEDEALAQVVMTSDGSGICAAGSTLTWASVEWNRVPPAADPPLGPIGTVRVTSDDTCSGSSSEQTWIHVSGA
jgi:hypothetical protein